MKIKGMFVAATLLLSLFTPMSASAEGAVFDVVVEPALQDATGIQANVLNTQTFRPTQDGQLLRMDLVMSSEQSSGEGVTVKIVEVDGSGTPNLDAVLATTTIATIEMSSERNWVPAFFANPATLTSGTQYGISVTVDDNSAEEYSWYSKDLLMEDYPDGSANLRTFFGTYNDRPDLGFRTYVGTYEDPKFLVTLNLNGGTLEGAQPIARPKDFKFVLPDLRQDENLFNGWLTPDEVAYGGAPDVSNIYTVGEADVTLNAQWLSLERPIIREITGNDNGASDWKWDWIGRGVHNNWDVGFLWCVFDGPGADPKTWMVNGRTSDFESESFQLRESNLFQEGDYKSTPDPIISYGKNSRQIVLPGTAIKTASLVNTGCPANKYKVEPALPRGLKLNEQTGEISGKATSLQAKTTYTVTAERWINEDTVQLDLNGAKYGWSTTNFELSVLSSLPGSGSVAKPAFSHYFVASKLMLDSADVTRLKNALSKLGAKSSITCTAYVYPGSTKAALAYSQRLGKLLCAQASKLYPGLKTTVKTVASGLAPRAASGAKWLPSSYRVDISK